MEEMFDFSSSFTSPQVFCWNLDSLVSKLNFSFSSAIENIHLDCSCIFQEQMDDYTILMERINDAVDNPKCCWPTSSDIISTAQNGGQTSCTSIIGSAPLAVVSVI
jgi:hypothetical protein